MKTHTIEISDEQLRLIRAACLFAVQHNGSLIGEERDEVELIAEMIFDVVEGAYEKDTIHGFCY